MAQKLADTANSACVYVGRLKKKVEGESKDGAAYQYQGGGADKSF